MKLNKPKYNIFKNTFYALSGLKEIFKNETSFKMQIIMLVVLGIIAFTLPIKLMYSYFLFISLFI